jgi:NAD(P) transhydrogenase
MPRLDLLVVGTGPSGQRAAVQAAKLGKNVAICERREVVGGVCVNTGTIPSKTFREAVLHLSGIAQRGMYGASYTVKERITAEDLLFRCNVVIQREIENIRFQMMRNGVSVLTGTAAFLDPHRLSVTGRAGRAEVEADTVVLATGSTPARPEGIEVDGETVIDSDGILGLKKLPRTLTVVGAGVIGTEYATMFAALGTDVTLIDRRPHLLEFVDGEIAEALQFVMRQWGVTLRLGEEVASVAVETPGRAAASLKSGKKIVSEMLLFSIGRQGATGELNLAAAGLSADGRGRLKVNAHYQTEVPHIYAVGDVIGFPALASTSQEQGRLAVCHAFGVPAASMPALFPFGVYSIPEISMVGKTEEALTAASVPYETGIAHFRETARGAIVGDAIGVLKLLFHRETRTLLGVHILGTSATELIHVGQAVMTLGGTLDYFVETVFNYPTFAEAYKVAALDAWNRLGPKTSWT